MQFDILGPARLNWSLCTELEFLKPFGAFASLTSLCLHFSAGEEICPHGL